MRVKAYQNHWLPKMLNVTAITLYPRIYMADTYEDAQKRNILNHEFIHVAQVREQGWIRFYATYLWQYLILFLTYRSQQEAYYHIPAEIEAYSNQATTPVPSNVKLVDGVMQETT